MYKQGILSFTLFFYNVYNGQSGTPLFDNIMIMAYPTAYTFFPILFVGVIDQALKDSTILRHPEVYYIGQQARLFNLKMMCLWEGNAFLHACVVFFITLCANAVIVRGLGPEEGATASPQSDGLATDHCILGTSVNFVLVLVCNLKLALHVRMWTKVHATVIFVCTFGWFVIHFAYANATFAHGWFGSDDSRECMNRAVGSPRFWLGVFLTPIACFGVETAVKTYLRTYTPEPFDLALQIESLGDRAAKRASKAEPGDGKNGGKVAPSEGKGASAVPPLNTRGSEGGGGLLLNALTAKLDTEADLGAKKATDEEELLAQDYRMHRFTHVFVNNPALEAQFRALFNEQGIRPLANLMGVGGIVASLYMVMQVIGNISAGKTFLISVGMALAGIVVFFVSFVLRRRTSGFVRFFQRHLQLILFIGLIVVETGMKITITGSSLQSAVIPMIAFMVLRLRFPLAVICVLWDGFSFAVYYVVRLRGQSDVSDGDFAYMLFYNWFLMSLLCGYGGYNRERSERRDFLMQLQVSCLPCRPPTPLLHLHHTSHI